MKKSFLAVLAVAFTFAVQAEWKVIGTAQVADTVTLAQSISKLGEFTGNAMLGMMAVGALNDLPGTAAFGPARKGAATLYPFFVENGQYEFALLYPVAITKEDFMGRFPDAVESNGLIRVTCPFNGSGRSVHYVAFSQDGRWVGMSDKPQQARLALKEITDAEKPLDGDMAKFRIRRRGLDEFVKGGEQEMDVRTKDLVSQVNGVVFGIRVSDKGLDFRGAVKTVEGSELAKVGLKPLAENPLAFAGRDAVFVGASAENCGYEPVEKCWNEVKPMIEKTGLKLDWLEFVQTNDVSRFTLDVDGLFACIKSMEGKADSKIGEKLMEELKQYVAAKDAKKLKAEGPAINCEFTLKGYAGRFLPAQRFAYTLPEVADKKPFSVGFFSVYSLIRAVLPAIAKVAPDQVPGIEAVIAMLPEEGQGGMAYALWADKGYLRLFVRIGADEFKAVSAGFAAFMAMSAANNAAGGDEEDDEEIDDEDDDLD